MLPPNLYGWLCEAGDNTEQGCGKAEHDVASNSHGIPLNAFLVLQQITPEAAGQPILLGRVVHGGGRHRGRKGAARHPRSVHPCPMAARAWGTTAIPTWSTAGACVTKGGGRISSAFDRKAAWVVRCSCNSSGKGTMFAVQANSRLRQPAIA